jgi:hypothetical protein
MLSANWEFTMPSLTRQLSRSQQVKPSRKTGPPILAGRHQARLQRRRRRSPARFIPISTLARRGAEKLRLRAGEQ